MHTSRHFCHLYGADEAFLEMLEPYVADGLLRGEGVIVIATAPHRASLVHRLEVFGIDVRCAVDEDRFIVLDAERFKQMSAALLARAPPPHPAR